MKLYFVADYDRWGHSLNIVRAESPKQAVELACGKWSQAEVVSINGDDDDRYSRVTVAELYAEGPPAVLWCEDESPDTGDRD